MKGKDTFPVLSLKGLTMVDAARELLIKRSPDGFVAERINVTGKTEAEIGEVVQSLVQSLDMDRYSIHDSQREGAARFV